MPEPRIVTRNIWPPIPCRGFDWVAYVDGREHECAYGPTEAEAIADLMNNYLQQD